MQRNQIIGETTFDGYNKELKTAKSASSNSPVILVETGWYNENPTWKNLGNTKNGMTGDTYGTILGNGESWLASCYVYLDSEYADFRVCKVTNSRLRGVSLYYSDDHEFGYGRFGASSNFFRRYTL